MATRERSSALVEVGAVRGNSSALVVEEATQGSSSGLAVEEAVIEWLPVIGASEPPEVL